MYGNEKNGAFKLVTRILSYRNSLLNANFRGLNLCCIMFLTADISAIIRSASADWIAPAHTQYNYQNRVDPMKYTTARWKKESDLHVILDVSL